MVWPFSKKTVKEEIQDPVQPIPGTVKVSVRDEGIFLIVTSPSGGGDAVETADACQALDAKGIIEVDMEAVLSAVREATGRPALVAPRKRELDQDGKVEVMVANDQMSARIQLIPPLGGEKVTYEDVLAALSKEGVVHGIDHERITAAIEKNEYYGTIVVAQGTESVDGEDSSVSYHFLLEKEAKPSQLLDGSVDYRNLDLVENVEGGTLLATLNLATTGSPGKTVKGKILPAKDGHNSPLLVGKNVELSEDGLKAWAKLDGQVVIVGGRLDVLPVYMVQGDVDFSTGNIKFNGTVIVQGVVRDGFKVEAKGNIQVNGSVEGAILESQADIILRGGIRGQGRAKLEAGGNFTARFVEKAHVKAQDTIRISEAAMHSTLEAGTRVLVEGGRGWLVGGTVSAGEEIRARTIGSKIGTNTELEVGYNPQNREQLQKVQAQLDELSKQLESVFQAIRLADKGLLSKGASEEQRDKIYIKLRKTEEGLSAKIRELEEEKHQLELSVEQLNKGAVRASEIIHPGVRVTIGKVTYLVRDEISHSSLQVNEGEICVRPF
jgi:uncharacterized protein (DUF342 family)